jgi:hypothetical protein
MPARSHSVSAPTRWIRKHGPGLAISTGAIKVPDDRSRHSTNALLAAATCAARCSGWSCFCAEGYQMAGMDVVLALPGPMCQGEME